MAVEKRTANALSLHWVDVTLVRLLLGSNAFTDDGAWVGGTATLSESSVAFAANAVNRLLHKAHADVSIPLGEVESVSWEAALVSSIVCVRSSGAVLMLRCFRAEAFADAIAEAATRARASHPPIVAVRVNSGQLGRELTAAARAVLNLSDG